MKWSLVLLMIGAVMTFYGYYTCNVKLFVLGSLPVGLAFAPLLGNIQERMFKGSFFGTIIMLIILIGIGVGFCAVSMGDRFPEFLDALLQDIGDFVRKFR